ncbi:MAG: T9SS type A sorting domain-containing protein [Bacteroidales bacterium]|nr:T9SS type A sorting domain-containing protein [Bacteroidales bacterium]
MRNFTFKRLTLILAVMMVSAVAFGQMPAAIQMDPPGATVFDDITLYFNPEEACFENGSLAGFPSVAMHSGVTIGGENWQNVVEFNATGANGESPIFEPTGDGRFVWAFNPAAFYGIEEGTIVTQICAVFNNGTNWDQDGRDWLGEECQDFFIPLSFAATDPKFVFKCNMKKMIQDGNFDPIEDVLYIDITDFGVVELVDADLDMVYDGSVEEGLTLDETYSMKFRINADTYEDVDRTMVAAAGTSTLEAWWNDEALGSITYIVDMSYQIILGTFDPGVDFVDVAGTMNEWGGSGAMADIGDGMYSVTYDVEDGEVEEYKFRINGDWETSEFPGGGPNRMTIGTDYPITLNLIYDNYKPGTYPATFNLDMSGAITDGYFDPATEYVDVAGSMNGWGGHDVLFDIDGQTENIYTITMMIDTGALFLEFKFRINGDWDNSEFPAGGPNRQWEVVDTAGGVVNLYEAIYNIFPSPVPPYVYDIMIEGDIYVDGTATASYTFFDPNGDAEGASIYQWARLDSITDPDPVLIPGANGLEYTFVEDDYLKFVAFGVMPISVEEPYAGEPNGALAGQIFHLGLIEGALENLSVYPNPVNNVLYIENSENVNRIVVHNLIGQEVTNVQVNSERLNISTTDWKQGLYFVVFFTEDNLQKVVKIVKE